ncbi:MAG: class I SAM-dependent methyltransferase [Candidatus Thorarchaeota archaeon]|jgi:SAM-dependent methyltransferase
MPASWDEVAADYHKTVGETGDSYHRTYVNPVIFDILGDVKDLSVLDLACGQGYLSRILARKGANVIGVDISEKMIEIAKTSEESEPLGVKYLRCNSRDISEIADASMDCIVSTFGFHDIKEIEATIDECSRVLKEGGKLVFAIPHPLTYARRTQDEEGYFLKMRHYMSVKEIPHPKYKDTEVVAYHRPLSFYFEKLFSVGFQMVAFREITTEQYRGRPIKDESLLTYKQEIPGFLVAGFVKGVK